MFVLKKATIMVGKFILNLFLKKEKKAPRY